MSLPFQLSDFPNYDKIATGGFGSTYHARHNVDGRDVCLKFIPLYGGSSRKRILQEAKILSKLKHPNIIEYYGSFVERDQFCIVMEYAANGSLHDLIKVRLVFFYLRTDVF